MEDEWLEKEVEVGDPINVDSARDAIIPQNSNVTMLTMKRVHRMNRCRCLYNCRCVTGDDDDDDGWTAAAAAAAAS